MPVLKVFGPPELSFVRASMRALSVGRRGCEHCHRTPLVGETVFMYGERIVCELCRPLRRQPPARSELMHAPEHERSVRVARRAA